MKTRTILFGLAFAAGVYVGVNVTLVAIKYSADKAYADTESKYADQA